MSFDRSVASFTTNDNQVDQWDFDPFELEEVTQGHPLVALSSYLFTVKYNLFSCFTFSKVRARATSHPSTMTRRCCCFKDSEKVTRACAYL